MFASVPAGFDALVAASHFDFNPLENVFNRLHLAPSHIFGMAFKDLVVELQELQRRPKCNDWGTKLQRTCEAIWSSLDSDNVDPKDLHSFQESLTRDSEALAVVKMVIPELRKQSTSALPTNSNKRLIASAVRGQLDPLEATQKDFDNFLFLAEKHTFLDSQLHRARLLLQRETKPTAKEEKEIMDWLKMAPGA